MQLWPGRRQRHRSPVVAGLLAVLPLVALVACAPQTAPGVPGAGNAGAAASGLRSVSDIDHLYLDAIGAIDAAGRLDKGTLQQLIDRLEAPGTAQASNDSCFRVKRHQMLPILFSLAMIDGLGDGQKQQDLRMAARSDLVALSTAHSDAAYRDACNGQGFPAVSRAQLGLSIRPAG